MDILECFESAPPDFYETPVIKYLDYLWERHGRKAIAFNCIYIAYPLILSLLTITSQQNLTENRIFGLIMTVMLIIIEMYQMHLGGIKEYFRTIQNVLDFSGITSTIIFYTFGDLMEPKVSVFFLIIGLVGAFYKGIMAVAILNESYRVLIKLIQNSIIDMIPFTVILIA